MITQKNHTTPYFQTCHLMKLYAMFYSMFNCMQKIEHPLNDTKKHGSHNVLETNRVLLSPTQSASSSGTEHFFDKTLNEVVGLHFSLYCIKKVYFQILGLHSALRDAHTLEGFWEQRVLFAWLICTLTCTPATAYAHGMREQWVPLPVVNSPFHFLLLTSLLSPLFLLFVSLSILLPLPFSPLPFMKKV